MRFGHWSTSARSARLWRASPVSLQSELLLHFVEKSNAVRPQGWHPWGTSEQLCHVATTTLKINDLDAQNTNSSAKGQAYGTYAPAGSRLTSRSMIDFIASRRSMIAR